MSKKRKTGSLTTRYKKQHGLHHKHSSKYIKVYWPYLPVFVLVMGGIIASIAILLSKPDTPINSNSISSISITSLYNATNSDRQSSKLSSLQLNSKLDTAAQEKANDMAMRNYWSPLSPSGQTPWQIIQSTGYQFQSAGENLAYGFSSAQSLLTAWLSSPSHRENILNGNYNDVGFGVADSPDFQNQGPQIIVVALYASTNAPTAASLSASKSSQAFTSASISLPNSQAVVKTDSILSNNGIVTIFISGLLVGTIGCFLIIRHGMLLRKWAVEGEKVIIRHPVMDIILVILLLGIASLNQTVGFIS